MGVFISISCCCINVEVMQLTPLTLHTVCIATSYNTAMYHLFMILRKPYGLAYSYRIPQEFQICCLPRTWDISKRKGQCHSSIKSLSHLPLK